MDKVKVVYIIHSIEYYLAVNRNEVLIHVTTSMYFKNIMLKESATKVLVLSGFIHMNLWNREIYRYRM